ncbi:MAG: hypothetical protein JNL82_20040 [Myxococcales bacterium]|nr:hypothetical protein [Myxococcales bacterium]
MGGLTRLFAVVVLTGCAAPATARPESGRTEPVKTESVTPPADARGEPPKEAPVEFEAVVRSDARPSGKKFQGVWLERADGERWVVAYRPQAWLRSFEGRAVRVTGETWEPEGQRVTATHFRVATLKVERRGEGPILAVGPEETLTGALRQATAPAGSKAEGSTWWVFATGEAEYEVEGAPDGVELAAGPATLVVRKVEPDMSYAARRGGPSLWIVAVR